MAKLSIEITGKIRSALFVLSALWEQGPTVAELVTDKLRTSLTGDQEPPGFLAQIQGLGQLLQGTLDLMTELDLLSVDENQSRATLFKDREDKVAYLGLRLTGLRRIVTGHYADPDLERLGLAGRNARESIALLRQSELISERLSSENLAPVLGDPLFEPPLDPRPYVQQVDSTLAELRAAFEAHQRSRRRVDELLERKKKAVKAYDTTFVRVARQFEDLCRLAGLDDLADKVRPSLTRRGQTAVEPEAGESSASPEDVTGNTDGDAAPPVEATAPEPDAAPDSQPETEPSSQSGDEPSSESTPAEA